MATQIYLWCLAEEMQHLDFSSPKIRRLLIIGPKHFILNTFMSMYIDSPCDC